jgi:putative chitinase
MINITVEILRKICPKVPIAKANLLSDLFKQICPKYGIINNDIFHEFFANVAHESGGFEIMTESLNYSVDALKRMFGRHRISIADAEKYGRSATQKANQRMIGNIIYGGKWGLQNLGNTLPNDGFDLRGGGYMQITGRRNYQKFTDWYNKLNNTKYTLQEIAVLIRTNELVSIHAACWLFAIEKKLIDEADADQITATRKAINGGTNGLADTIKYWELAKKFII